MEDIIDAFMKQNHGQVTTADARKLGVDPHFLIDLANRGKLERVDRGVYIDPAIFEDDMYILQYRFTRGVYFKDSALFLHHMIDRTPDRYQVNFPRGYYPTAIGQYPVRVYHQKVEWQTLGVEEVLTLDNTKSGCTTLNARCVIFCARVTRQILKRFARR